MSQKSAFGCFWSYEKKAKIAILRPTNTQSRGPPPQVSPNSCLGVYQRRCKPILAPTTPYCHYPDMRKSRKKQNLCEKWSKVDFLTLGHGGLRGSGPYYIII